MNMHCCILNYQQYKWTHTVTETLKCYILISRFRPLALWQEVLHSVHFAANTCIILLNQIMSASNGLLNDMKNNIALLKKKVSILLESLIEGFITLLRINRGLSRKWIWFQRTQKSHKKPTKKKKEEYSLRTFIELFPSYLKCCETQSRQQTTFQLQTEAKESERAMTSLQWR